MDEPGARVLGRIPRRRPRRSDSAPEVEAPLDQNVRHYALPARGAGRRFKAALVEEIVELVLVRLAEKDQNPAVDSATVRRLHTQADLEKGLVHFRKIKPGLGYDFYSQYVTIDVDTGEHEFGPSALSAVAAFRAKFGLEHHIFTYHVGTTN